MSQIHLHRPYEGYNIVHIRLIKVTAIQEGIDKLAPAQQWVWPHQFSANKAPNKTSYKENPVGRFSIFLIKLWIFLKYKFCGHIERVVGNQHIVMMLSKYTIH